MKTDTSKSAHIAFTTLRPYSSWITQVWCEDSSGEALGTGANTVSVKSKGDVYTV